MRKKKKKTCWKIHYFPCGFREDTAQKKSWPITTLATTGQRRHNVWVVARAGARVYHTATKYMRIIYL